MRGKKRSFESKCTICDHLAHMYEEGKDCLMHEPDGTVCKGVLNFIKPPMTKEECENWIMLKGQTNERWFEIVILDDEVGQDPTMIALMETVSDMIFRGIQGMPFTESQQAGKSNLEVVKS